MVVIVVICVYCDDCVHGKLLGGFDYVAGCTCVDVVVVVVV